MTTQVLSPAATVHQTELGAVTTDKKVSLTRIMVMTDFSEASDMALNYALALARRYDARIYLAHVLTQDAYQMAEPALAQMTYQRMRQGAEQSIADILISGKLRGVPHEVLLEEGYYWPVVERLIQEHEIDLVVTGTHGRGEFKKVLLGSAAEEVFRRANCAVLTVGPHNPKRAPQEMEFNDILFATDFGPGATRAAQYAFSLAQEHGARLTVVHVVEAAVAYTREGEERLRQIHIAGMKQFMPAGAENWCKVDFRVAFGAQVEEILNEARETGADLIVMGAKTRKALAGHRPLSIAYNVVTKAHCPVLTVRG
jgi:nucleotide-binding universal stress UspA family protein